MRGQALKSTDTVTGSVLAKKDIYLVNLKILLLRRFEFDLPFVSCAKK